MPLTRKPLTDEQRKELFNETLAEGLAIQHRFAAEPALKHGKPIYKSNTVEAIAHLKAKEHARSATRLAP